MPVHARIGNRDTLVLGLIARPGVIGIEVIAQILGQYGAVERADDLDVQVGGLLEHGLHELAELTDDAKVVAASLASPALGILDVVGAKLAKAVGTKEHLVGPL